VYRAGTRLFKYFAKRCKELGLNLDEIELFQGPKAKSGRLDEDDMESDDTIDSEDDEETETRKKR